VTGHNFTIISHNSLCVFCLLSDLPDLLQYV
jgi:hypothetical protein